MFFAFTTCLFKIKPFNKILKYLNSTAVIYLFKKTAKLNDKLISISETELLKWSYFPKLSVDKNVAKLTITIW